MPTTSRVRLLICFVAFSAFASWLAIFFNDPARPLTIQEKADLLAAENLTSLTLGAPTPPSPHHWAQRGVYLSAKTGERYPLSRDASALALAASGLDRRIAGIMSFGLAAACLYWLLIRQFPRFYAGNFCLVASLLLAVAHGREWQMTDPFPYLLLAATALCLGGWLHFRTSPGRPSALLLGAGLSGVLLCEPALFILNVVLVVADLILKFRSGPPPARNAGWAFLIPVLLLLVFGARNLASTGSFWTSVSARYEMENTSAPVWIWQSIRTPPEGVDPMIERYDELVALPASRWEVPAVRTWLQRLTMGAHFGGGLALVLAALAVATLRPSPEHRPALLIAAGMAFIALAYYPLSAAWWTVLTPAIAILIADFFSGLPTAGGMRRAAWSLALLHLTFIYFGVQSKPSAAEYDYTKYLSQIATKLRQQPGEHLVFVDYDVTADAHVEPAGLPRNWSNEKILYARDLSPEQNATLAAAMPDRKLWRMVIYRDQIGILHWNPQAEAKSTVSSPSANPDES